MWFISKLTFIQNSEFKIVIKYIIYAKKVCDCLQDWKIKNIFFKRKLSDWAKIHKEKV